MKLIRIITLLAFIFSFTSISFVAEAKDCSHLKKLHKKLMCKAGSDLYDSNTSATSKETNKSVKKEKKSKKERGGEDVNTLEKLFKKIDEKVN